jgi:hypothetical protein
MNCYLCGRYEPGVGGGDGWTRTTDLGIMRPIETDEEDED